MHPKNFGQQHYYQILIINKMKKIYLIMLTVFLNFAMFSCSPQTIADGGDPQLTEEQDCCGDGSTIPPPPPPSDGD